MKLKPIITSLLQNDAYKFNMSNIILNKYSAYTTRWAFKCRNQDVKFTPEMINEIRDQIDYFCSLRFTQDELDYLREKFSWLSPGYVNFLEFWHPKRSEILINEGNIQPYKNDDNSDCGLAIETNGVWLNVSFYEIPILAIVGEVYYAFTYGIGAKDIEFQKRTIEKFEKFFDQRTWELILDNGIDSGEHHAVCINGTQLQSDEYRKTHPYEIGTFSEFGMRRRYSSDMQDWLVKYLVDQKVPGFIGTSNVYLAKKYGMTAAGTQAHEYYQAYQGNPMIAKEYSNFYGMKDWIEQYGTNLGIALTDTLGTEVFLKDFGQKFATLFKGVRHDSGDPIEWGENMIAHYKSLGIDPKTKTLLFSDSLNFERATNIKRHFDNKINVAFGIGTFLSCDLDVPVLNIVHKMVECNGYPVAKLSNCLGKCMSKDAEYVEYLKRCIDWRLRHER